MQGFHLLLLKPLLLRRRLDNDVGGLRRERSSLARQFKKLSADIERGLQKRIVLELPRLRTLCPRAANLRRALEVCEHNRAENGRAAVTLATGNGDLPAILAVEEEPTVERPVAKRRKPWKFAAQDGEVGFRENVRRKDVYWQREVVLAHFELDVGHDAAAIAGHRLGSFTQSPPELAHELWIVDVELLDFACASRDEFVRMRVHPSRRDRRDRRAVGRV